MTGGLSLLGGVLLALGASALPGTAWMLTAALSCALLLLTTLRQWLPGRCAALLLAGMWLTFLQVGQWRELAMPRPQGEVRLLFEGRVLNVPSRGEGEVRVDLEGQIVAGAVDGGPDERMRRARLSWRHDGVLPRAGERWRLLIRQTPFESTRNFAGSDAARYIFRDRVHLTGRVLPSNLNTRLRLAHASIDSARARVAARIGEAVGDPDAAALLIALAVGLTDGMSADQWRVFNATGTTHLVAISGLHVTLFALLAFALARFIWSWLPWARRVEREPFALLLGLAAAGAYALLAGLSVPTQRTWLMLAIFAVARLAARHTGAARSWALALGAVLLFDPFAPLAAGFWLSFVAVGVLLWVAHSAAHGASNDKGSWALGLWRAVQLQFAIMLALAPLTFGVFGGFSLAGLWVNLIAIPLISLVFVPLVLCGALAALTVPQLCPWIFAAAAAIHVWMWPALVWAADGSHALWRMSPPLWWYALAVPAVLVLLGRWPPGLRVTALCAALPLLFPNSRLPPAQSARVSVFDAGRGVAVLIVTRSHVLLFDTGDSWNTRGSRLREVVTPALDAQGLPYVDRLILPALNPDRALGAAWLAFERGLHGVWAGGGWPATSLPAHRCRDSSFDRDGVQFTTFAAGPAGSFCVLRVAVGEHGILLSGELDATAERGLINRLGMDAVRSDVVLVSRQASTRASSAEWIEASAPGLVIASGGVAGSGARQRTLERWRQSGARVLDTREAGGVNLDLGTRGVRVAGVASASRYPFHWRHAHSNAR